MMKPRHGKAKRLAQGQARPPAPTTSLSRKVGYWSLVKRGSTRLRPEGPSPCPPAEPSGKGMWLSHLPSVTLIYPAWQRRGRASQELTWKRANLDSERAQGLKQNKEGGLPLSGCQSSQTSIQGEFSFVSHSISLLWSFHMALIRMFVRAFYKLWWAIQTKWPACIINHLIINKSVWPCRLSM